MDAATAKRVLAVQDRESMRTTVLCRACANEWREWRRLIYGADDVPAGGRVS